jgi:hypothetical protein
MKSLMFAAALMIGGAAMAQDTTGTGTTTTGTGTGTGTGTNTGTQGTAGTTGTTTTTGTGTMSGTGSMSGTGPMSGTGSMSGMAGGTTQAPGNMAPERDARGIAVISAEAAAPAGYNQPASNAAQPTPTVSSMGAAGQLPPCTRTVTDRCTQTYERGVRASR